MNRVVVLEDRSQVQWVFRNIKVDAHTKLLAITAGAVQALEELGLPYTAIAEVADTRLLASVEGQYSLDCLDLLSDIEDWILKKYPPAGQVGQGFLTGQAYYVQMSIGGIATRAFLMREAVRAFSPASVTLFHDGIDNWFGGDGYLRNPWIETFLAMSEEYCFQVEIVPLQKPRSNVDASRVRDVYLNLRRCVIEWVKGAFGLWKRIWLKTRNDTTAFRLLIADAQSNDWAPVLDVLRDDRRFSLYFLKSANLDGYRWWAYFYQDMVYGDSLSKGLSLKSTPIAFDKSEQDTLSALLDNWVTAYPDRARMNVLGIELFPALLPHLRSMLLLSIPLMRYTNEMAVRALESTRPHAVCFNSMTWLSSMTLALQARRRGIPVISYQHGGSYGIQVVPTHDFAEFAHSDYFITYGEGIHPPHDPVTPTRAQFVPVGSALIERMVKNDPAGHNIGDSIHVLWIGEVSLENTIGGAWLVEDTSRFLLEMKSLKILGAEKINVVYRPFPYNMEALATPEWLERAGLPTVRVDKQQSLEKSIRESDVVICDSSSSTTWNEVLALRKPLIVYCDPQQTILMPHFAEDLDWACHWCKSVTELIKMVEMLAKEPEGFINELRRRPTDEYLRKYVLHKGNSVERVISIVSAICSEKLQSQNALNSEMNEPKQAGFINGQG